MESGLAKYTYSKMHGAKLCWWQMRVWQFPFISIKIASPCLTSLEMKKQGKSINHENLKKHSTPIAPRCRLMDLPNELKTQSINGDRLGTKDEIQRLLGGFHIRGRLRDTMFVHMISVDIH